MSEPRGRVQRRLAAILAADIVGYSRLMEADEAGTLARVKALRAELLNPKVTEYGGRIVKTTGDGTLIEFPSAVDAVQHAVDVQQEMARRSAGEPEAKRIVLRMGINLGDIIIDGDDIYGDGVNIAARLEGLAEPGGIFVSGIVYESVRKKLDLAFDDLGERDIKNMAPVRIYRAVAKRAPTESASSTQAILSRPAIAVLPFANMSGDPDQEYFVDGLTEDIITALTAWRSFPVVGRNSTFVYKGRSVDLRQTAKDLAARYVLEGSARKGGSRVRVTAQLIDAETGTHLWAERYDRELADIFSLQDELTSRIASTLVPELERAERSRTAAKPPANLDAWDCYLRGLAHLNGLSGTALPQGRMMFERAIALDPDFAAAHACLALVMHREIYWGLVERTPERVQAMFVAARRAVELDDSNWTAQWVLALAYNHQRQHEKAYGAAERAVILNPTAAFAHFTLGGAALSLGKHEVGFRSIDTAILMAPQDPAKKLFSSYAARAHLVLGDFDRAVVAGRAAIQRGAEVTPDDFAGIMARHLLAAALGHQGKADEARAVMAAFGATPPPFVDNFAKFWGLDPVAERVREGLAKAGLTDNQP